MAMIEAVFIGMVLGLVLAAALGFVWQRRSLGPAKAALMAGRAFQHGERDRRANPQLGGPLARETANVVNGLIETAEAMSLAARDQAIADILEVAARIEAMGEGRLKPELPELKPPFEPIGEALARARAQLMRLFSQLESVSVEATTELSAVGQAARHFAATAQSEKESLQKLSRRLLEQERALSEASDELKDGLQSFFEAAAQSRRVSAEARASIPLLSRRIADLQTNVERAERQLQSAAIIDQALGLLSEQNHTGVVPRPERVAPILRDARAAQASLRQELVELSRALSTIADSLSASARNLPEPASRIDRAAAGPILKMGLLMSEGLSACQEAVNGLEASAQLRHKSAHKLKAASKAGRSLSKDLALLLIDLRPAAAFDEALLWRLERAREALERAESEGELTEAMQKMLDALLEESEAAKGRIHRLADLAEASRQAFGDA